MAHFDAKLWAEIAPRFRALMRGKKIEKFLAENDLMGLKWRQVADGRQGMSVESLVKVCLAFDCSPTWLLFNKGRKQLSTILDVMPELDEQRERRYAMLFEALPAKQKTEVMNYIKELQQQHDKTQLHGDHETPPPRKPRGSGAKN